MTQHADPGRTTYGGEPPLGNAAPPRPFLSDVAGPGDMSHLDHLVAIVDNAPDVLSRFDRDLRYLFINKTAEHSTGIPRDHFIGKTFRDLGFPEENCAQWEESLRRAFATGEPNFIEFSVPLPTGLRHYEGRAFAERGPDERVETVLTITRDITERKQAEEALRQHAQVQEAILASLSESVLVADAEGRLLQRGARLRRGRTSG